MPRALLLRLAAARALVLLGPPASHYDYYKSMRDELFDFAATFDRAANATGEGLLAVVDDRGMKSLRSRGVERAISGVLDDVWMRDFFVFQLSDEVLVRFDYDPAYLSGEDVRYIDQARRDVWRKIWPGDVTAIDVVLDGGNLAWEPATRRAVVSERVLRDNPGLLGKSFGEADKGALDPYAGAPTISDADAAAGADALGALLAEALGEAVTVAMVPEEPGAPTLGHVDGVANWLAEDVLALSNFTDAATYALFADRIAAAFGDAVRIVPFPYEPVDAAWKDGMASAEGVYVNFARTTTAIFVPQFGREADARALAIAAEHGSPAPVGVDASSVAIMGGSVRCLSTYVWGEFAAAAEARSEDVDEEADAAGRDVARLGALASTVAAALLLV